MGKYVGRRGSGINPSRHCETRLFTRELVLGRCNDQQLMGSDQCSPSTLQFRIWRGRLAEKYLLLRKSEVQSEQWSIDLTVQIQSRRKKIPMPKKETDQARRQCRLLQRQKLRLANVVKMNQYPQITRAVQRSAELLQRERERHRATHRQSVAPLTTTQHD